MFLKIKKKLNSDKGNAIIVLGIMLIMALLIVGGMLLDISKAFQMKHAYTNAARKAAQAGIMHQNSSGYLKAEAATEAIKVYENVTRPSIINDGFMSTCGDTRDILVTVYFTEGDNVQRRGRHRAEIMSNNVQESDDAGNLLNKVTFYSDSSPTSDFMSIQNEQYTGIELEINESTPNVILPGSARIAEGMWGGNNSESLNCQVLGIRQGASQLIGADGYN